MNGNTFRTLEFDTIRALLLHEAGSAGGRAVLQALRPSTDAGVVRQALEHTSEAVAVLGGPGRQPYHDLPDVREALAQARIAGQHLDPGPLLDVASFIEGATETAFRLARFEPAPRLARLAATVLDETAVAVAIRRALLPTGEVADDASPRLGETRRALARLRAQLHSVMESYLRGKDADRLLQEKLVTTRNDRYVLLVKAEQRSALPGIVHGSSGSGASFFVEPLPAVELNNDIVSLADQERQEVRRILTELTARVGERAASIGHAAEVMAELDALQARALLARVLDAVEPEISADLSLELIEARHPLLMPNVTERIGLPRRSPRPPVPVSVRVGFGSPVLVISGPNTGGKTVALKTVGLLALMSQCGLHIPAAAGSRLPVFRSLYADIGDDQSIAADLSTFSAHLASIVEMTRDLEQPALVLLDEVGAGTDPTEGGALGVAIVDHFRQRGAMVVATTHHGLMKAYAQSTAGVGCASFGYDPQTYAPTYRLTLGAPGRSLALEMAERLGLPASVVADARARRDVKEAQAETLLQKLEQDQARLAADEVRLAQERALLDEALAAQRGREQEDSARRRREVDLFVKDLRRSSEDAARKAADAIQQAVRRVEAAPRAATREGLRARTQALGVIREAEKEALVDPALGLEPDPEISGRPVVVGDRVRVAGLGVVGEVLALDDEAEVAVSGKRLRVPPSTLQLVSSPLPAGERDRVRGKSAAVSRHPSSSSVAVPTRPEVPAEVNLVGLTVDEALPRLEKVLDAAVLSDRREVRIIHGFGTGTLRRAVVGLLDDHPLVAAHRPGGPREGGAGATVVEIKD